MMTRHIAVAFTLAVLPTLATAQRGGGGGSSRTGRDPEMRRMENEQASAPRFATREDIENFGPAAFLRDKRKKLQLSDADAAALKAAEQAARDRNRETLAAYDSVRREVQKYSGGADLGSNANDATLRRMAFANLTSQIREMRAKDRAEALAAVPADKREQAETALKEQDEQFDKKMGAGGRGGRGGQGGPGNR